MTAQHATLTPQRWSTFSLEQQILMIANELNRAGKLVAADDRDRRRRSYERVLALVDLTVDAQPRRSLRREMLRWRDLVAALYLLDTVPAADFAAALRALLLFTPAAARQIQALAAVR